MLRAARRRRNFRIITTAVLAVLAVCASLVAGDQTNPIDGFFYDLSLAATKARPGSGANPVAVIALDRDSLAADEFAPLPRVFLTPIWARILDGLIASDVRTVGFDIVFEYSANRLPGSDGQYDKPFLEALVRARDRVLLARSARAVPAQPFVAAALDTGADIELSPDTDGIYRWMEASLEMADGQSVPTFAAAVLSQARSVAMPSQLLLAPAAPLELIPAYRVVDVLRCLDRDPGALREVFAGKIVLIGTNLPEEDRKPTPDRFMRAPSPQHISA